MIFTVNTNGYVLYPVAKSTFEMSDKDVYEMINYEFSVMANRLKKKGIRIGSTTGYNNKMMEKVSLTAKNFGYEPECVVTPDVTGVGGLRLLCCTNV